MQRKHLRFGRGFHVAIGSSRSQAATMTLDPGASEGGPHNRHRGADQWLFVVAGTDRDRPRQRQTLPTTGGIVGAHEHGDRHEITNTGRGRLRTLNLYVPPAYTSEGDELPRAKG